MTESAASRTEGPQIMSGRLSVLCVCHGPVEEKANTASTSLTPLQLVRQVMPVSAEFRTLKGGSASISWNSSHDTNFQVYENSEVAVVFSGTIENASELKRITLGLPEELEMNCAELIGRLLLQRKFFFFASLRGSFSVVLYNLTTSEAVAACSDPPPEDGPQALWQGKDPASGGLVIADAPLNLGAGESMTQIPIGHFIFGSESQRIPKKIGRAEMQYSGKTATSAASRALSGLVRPRPPSAPAASAPTPQLPTPNQPAKPKEPAAAAPLGPNTLGDVAPSKTSIGQNTKLVSTPGQLKAKSSSSQATLSAPRRTTTTPSARGSADLADTWRPSGAGVSRKAVVEATSSLFATGPKGGAGAGAEKSSSANKRTATGPGTTTPSAKGSADLVGSWRSIRSAEVELSCEDVTSSLSALGFTSCDEEPVAEQKEEGVRMDAGDAICEEHCGKDVPLIDGLTEFPMLDASLIDIATAMSAMLEQSMEKDRETETEKESTTTFTPSDIPTKRGTTTPSARGAADLADTWRRSANESSASQITWKVVAQSPETRPGSGRKGGAEGDRWRRHPTVPMEITSWSSSSSSSSSDKKSPRSVLAAGKGSSKRGNRLEAYVEMEEKAEHPKVQQLKSSKRNTRKTRSNSDGSKEMAKACAGLRVRLSGTAFDD